MISISMAVGGISADPNTFIFPNLGSSDGSGNPSLVEVALVKII